jgi:hypothetical protein
MVHLESSGIRSWSWQQGLLTNLHEVSHFKVHKMLYNITSRSGPKAHRWWEKKSGRTTLTKSKVEEFQPSIECNNAEFFNLTRASRVLNWRRKGSMIYEGCEELLIPNQREGIVAAKTIFRSCNCLMQRFCG